MAEVVQSEETTEEFAVHLGDTWKENSSNSLATLRYERRFQAASNKSTTINSNDTSHKIVGSIQMNDESIQVKVSWHAIEGGKYGSTDFFGVKEKAGPSDCVLVLNEDKTFTLERLDTLIINLRPEAVVNQLRQSKSTTTTTTMAKQMEKKRKLAQQAANKNKKEISVNSTANGDGGGAASTEKKSKKSEEIDGPKKPRSVKVPPIVINNKRQRAIDKISLILGEVGL